MKAGPTWVSDTVWIPRKGRKKSLEFMIRHFENQLLLQKLVDPVVMLEVSALFLYLVDGNPHADVYTHESLRYLEKLL